MILIPMNDTLKKHYININIFADTPPSRGGRKEMGKNGKIQYDRLLKLRLLRS